MNKPFDSVPKSGLTKQLSPALFPLFEQASAGAIAVDRNARVTWINSSYLNLLGIADVETVIGQPIQQVIPETRMPEVVKSGTPILLDIMEYHQQQLIVTRLPLFDDAGTANGAVAFVLHDNLQPLTPLVRKYRRLHQDLIADRHALARPDRSIRYCLGDFAGASPAALEVKRRARLAAARDVPILLTGETGTGKDVLAQAIHALSERAGQPFVSVDIAAVPENLLEAEFFGVAPGASTGTGHHSRVGKMQLAHGGTLFLNEVGHMSLPLQGKLLHALQQRAVQPLGSDRAQSVNIRVIAATSRNLDNMIADGTFRSDLYYRLNMLEIPIPPLRERLMDMGVLCEAVLESICSQLGLRGEMTDSAVIALSGYDWPGNIRELRNVLEQALIMRGDAGILDADTICKVLPGGTPEIPAGDEPRPLAQVIADAEARAIHAALAATHGNRSKAAQLLGISRSALYEKLAKYEV